VIGLRSWRIRGSQIDGGGSRPQERLSEERLKPRHGRAFYLEDVGNSAQTASRGPPLENSWWDVVKRLGLWSPFDGWLFIVRHLSFHSNDSCSGTRLGHEHPTLRGSDTVALACASCACWSAASSARLFWRCRATFPCRALPARGLHAA